MTVPKLIKRIYRRLTTDGSTEEQAIQSGFWVAGINIGDRVLQLLKVIILARLLSPAAFGLLGIAVLVLSGLRRFSTLGFDEALIQNKSENVDAYLNTAWIMKIVRGVVIAVIAILAAPHLADLFNEPRAEPLIQVIGAANLLLAVQNPAIVYFRKDLNFHKEFIYKTSARLIDFTVAVGFALYYRSVWALAAGIVAMNFVQFGLSYVIIDYRPHFEFDFDYAREMFSFGKWMFAQSALLFLFFEADDGFVGWFFTASALGFYQLAYRYSNAPATEVTQVVGRVAFPAFSKVQNNTEALRSGFLRVIQLSTIISFPMAAGIAVVAPQFVYVVLGDQWEPMISMMQVLALWGAMRSIDGSFGSVYKAVGRPDLEVKLLALRVTLAGLLVYPAANQFGVVGVASVLVLQNIISQPVGVYLTLSVVEGEFQEFIQIIAFPAFGSILMALSVFSIDWFLFKETGIAQLIFLIMSGIIVYCLIMIGIEDLTEHEFVTIYKNIRKSI